MNHSIYRYISNKNVFNIYAKTLQEPKVQVEPAIYHVTNWNMWHCLFPQTDVMIRCSPPNLIDIFKNTNEILFDFCQNQQTHSKTHMEIKMNFNNQNTFEKKCSLLQAAATNICAFKWFQQNLTRALPSPGITLNEAKRRETFVLVLKEATTLAEVTTTILWK